MALSKQAKLTDGPVGETLVRLTIPMIGGIVAIMLFNIADTYFLGQLGSEQLAAISFTFPVIFIIGSVALGLGTGTASVLSRAIGKGDRSRIRRLSTDSLLLSVSLVIVLAVLGLLTIRPLFSLLGADGRILEMVEEYMTIWYIGIVFLIVPMVGNSAIRATGDTKIPGLIMVFSAVINIVLDPILIFGYGIFPRMEIKGAAIATVFARALTLLASLAVLHFREHLIDWKWAGWKHIRSSWQEILYVGLPASATNTMVPLSMAIVTAMVAQYGPKAVAGFGVGGRIDALALMVIMALSVSLGPFVGQNWGAKNFGRVKTALKLSRKFTLLWGIGVGLFVIILAPHIGPVFNEDPIVIETIKHYLWIVPVSYGLQGLVMITGSTFNTINRPLRSTMLTVLRLFVFYIPLALIAGRFFEANGIFAGLSAANFLSGLVALYWLHKHLLRSI